MFRSITTDLDATVCRKTKNLALLEFVELFFACKGICSNKHHTQLTGDWINDTGREIRLPLGGTAVSRFKF